MTATRRPRILIVDDDPRNLRLLEAILVPHGFEPIAAASGQEALTAAAARPPDAVLLDVMMPGMDGFEVARRVREFTDVPIIMVTARDREQDKVKALDLGADDYVTKPFGAAELMARLRAVLRRSMAVQASTNPAEPIIQSGDVRVDLARRRVTRGGGEVKLSPTEYGVLRELALNAGKVVASTQILKRVWGPEYGDETEYVRVFVNRLRTKLEADPSDPRIIMSIPRVGYRLEVPDEPGQQAAVI